ncbi:MAG TPA: hypothetical protein VFU12_03020 [Glycomyces sp.]|nr:hypothetical protein [Glycomyces sp.]
MRLIRWTTGIAHSLRGFAVRVHDRTDHLPRLPFGIAVGTAVLMLLVAIETGPDHDRSVTEVEELALSGDGATHVNEPAAMVPASLEIVEYGFGAVVDHQGGERLSLGAVIRNPHEALVMQSNLTVVGVDEHGRPYTVEQVYLDMIPPDTSVPVGYVLLERPERVDVDSLHLVVENAHMWSPPEESADADLYALSTGAYRKPRIDIVDIEPLFSPEGYRITYQVEATEELDYLETVKITLVFRDGAGAIVGGMPGWGDPFGGGAGMGGYRSVPPGVSFQYVDLPLAYIPDGADLNKSEIGPGV